MVLEENIGRKLANDELWRFLKAFVIIHYDFQSAVGSRDAAKAVDRLKGILAPEHRFHANRIWDHLIAKAGELIPVGGGAVRSTLVKQLHRDGFAIGAAPSFWRDLQSVQRESKRALDDIKSHIHGLTLHRAEAYHQTRAALRDGRFVQIDGEPGSGKSALLKEIAEEYGRYGPVFVLKDSRIHPKGWAAHAHVLRVSDDVTALLREFAWAREPILFIDGIDKITDPAIQLTVNDVLKAIANNERLFAWRILVTIREQNLKHLETWLDPDAMKKLPLRTITMKPLDDEELGIVATAFPRLRPLLTQSGGADVILKRPFFLNALFAYVLETGESADSWKALLDVTGDATLRPVWQRAILTSCLQSTRTTQLLTKLTDYLLENNSERLKKLLFAIGTIEVLPNPLFLNEQLLPDLEPEDRAKYAHYAAVPKPLTWVRFLNWLMPQIATLPPSLIPNMLPVFTTWQNAFAGQNVRHCRKIGEISYAWLKEVEESLHPKRMKDLRNPFGGALRGRDIEKSIRVLFLSSAGDVPDLASEYLRGKASDKKHVHIFREQILQNSGALIGHLPSISLTFS